MTLHHKGPRQSTPAGPDRSTDGDSGAVFARDDCREQLRLIAEDAQNFKIRLFYAEGDSGVDEWRKFPERKSEWVKQAAAAITTYLEVIRAATRDRSAMAKQFNECCPLFYVHTGRLLATIREIYDRASEGATSDDGGGPRMDPHEAERDIEEHIARCELQIKRAVTGPFKSFDAWIAQERNQRGQASTGVPPESTLPPKRTKMSMYVSRIDAADLTEVQRGVFMMRMERGMGFRAIARQLGKHESTIREHYVAALNKLAKLKR